MTNSSVELSEFSDNGSNTVSAVELFKDYNRTGYKTSASLKHPQTDLSISLLNTNLSTEVCNKDNRICKLQL